MSKSKCANLTQQNPLPPPSLPLIHAKHSHLFPHILTRPPSNLVNQRVLQKQLRNAGFTVHVANHGGEALDKIRQSTHYADPSSPPSSPRNVLDLSVCLMDKEMPCMDGLAATRKIREWESSGKIVRHLPIIAVTANARAEQIAQLLAAGMDDVVSKPFRIPELVPKIEELAAKWARSDENEDVS